MAKFDYPFTRYASYDREAVAAALEPDYHFQPQVGSWGISGIVRFGESNFVFFVTFGQKQAEHEFDEAVYDNGILRWQSQPGQKLTDPTIKRLIAHDHLTQDILLFLRTTSRAPYVFMGFLKYVNHDAERERPVHFHWEILNFDRSVNYDAMMGLRLEPAPGETAVEVRSSPAHPAPALIRQAIPQGQGSGIHLSTKAFRTTVVDYEERDRRNRALGKLGEGLVLEHERNRLRQAGRSDLADKVEPVSWTIGDGLGYDIRSFVAATGEEIHIEVKTTTGPAETPFFMSSSEVEYARVCGARYQLYRLYRYENHSSQIPFFVLDSLFAAERCELTPANYRVRLK